jgi:hypothetical protein
MQQGKREGEKRERERERSHALVAHAFNSRYSGGRD